MTKTAIIVTIVTALGVALVFFLFGSNSAEAPIVDQPCPAGTTRVGEGCMPLKDACELQGDSYHFDESTRGCINT